MQTALAQDNQNQETLGTFGELWDYFYCMVGLGKCWLLTRENLSIQVYGWQTKWFPKKNSLQRSFSV